MLRKKKKLSTTAFANVCLIRPHWIQFVLIRWSLFQQHNLYVYRYFACELLCLINILTQLYLMDLFFEGEFLSYGLRVIQFSETPQEERIDPMVYVFPRVTKCIFHKYGPSGTIQKHDLLCILPLNIVNEKTYIFIWFWFLILTVALVGLVMYRLAIILTPAIRHRLLHVSSRLLAAETCRSITKKVDLGDWWILYVLSSNMDSLLYRDFLQELTKRMGEHLPIKKPISPWVRLRITVKR